MDIHENAKLTPRSGTGIGKRVLEEEPTAAAVSANRSPHATRWPCRQAVPVPDPPPGVRVPQLVQP